MAIATAYWLDEYRQDVASLFNESVALASNALYGRLQHVVPVGEQVGYIVRGLGFCSQ